MSTFLSLALQGLAPPSPPTPPPKTLIEKWMHLFESPNKVFVRSTTAFGIISLCLLLGSAIFVCLKVGPTRILAKKAILFFIFVEACLSTFFNSYAATIPDEPGLLEFVALVDIVNAGTTAMLTAFQYSDEYRKGNKLCGALASFLLCGAVAIIRLPIPFIFGLAKVHLYLSDTATVISTLSAFVPAFADVMKEANTPRSTEEATSIDDEDLERGPNEEGQRLLNFASLPDLEAAQSRWTSVFRRRSSHL